METVGESFKRARKIQKIDLNTVSQDLKISENLLRDFENNDFPNYINVAFIIGHIRSYAKYLNLDEKLLIENFKVQISLDGVTQSNEMRKLNKPVTHLSFFKALSFVSIIIISTSFYLLFIAPNDLQPDYAMTPNIPENFEANLEQIEMELALEKKLANNKSEDLNQIISDSSQIVKDEDDMISSTSAVASIPNTNNNNIVDIIVTLKFLNSAWVQLRDPNGNIIISKLMTKDDEYSYKISENLNLTSGNAGNIIIVFDGVVKGKAGKIGEVIDSLIIDKHFNN